MAPEVVQQSLKSVPKFGKVLDPMCGSGTVPRAAVEAGLRCVGADVDPLSVLMARVWTTRIDTSRMLGIAEEIVEDAKRLPDSAIGRPTDLETRQFIRYWFAPDQEECLARLATVLALITEPTQGALAIALSRIIISKEMLASLARDTSHSRPHKVSQTNDFDVYEGFMRSVRQVAERLQPSLIQGAAEISCADARRLDNLADKSFDLVLTSPPYLNAIDYLRGHRLSLVWLGYPIKYLRRIRSDSVGAERILQEEEISYDISDFIIEANGSRLEPQQRGWIRRYASDMHSVLCQLRRVAKKSGRIVIVLGNSFLRGTIIDNAGLVRFLAEQLGLRLVDLHVREIPARRRYLPPPGDGEGALDARMRTEAVLTFCL